MGCTFKLSENNFTAKIPLKRLNIAVPFDINMHPKWKCKDYSPLQVGITDVISRSQSWREELWHTDNPALKALYTVIFRTKRGQGPKHDFPAVIR